jgi:DegV family protein with EDD domain
VVCITITSNHSATYRVALSASEQFDPGQITLVDSRTLSLAQGLLVLAAARAAARGKKADEIVAMIDDLRRRLHLYITLDTVEYLVRGGRASRIVGIMASLLKIRPILTLADGELTMLDRVRGREASKKRLLELVTGCLPAEQIGVAHIACEDEASDFVPLVADALGAPREDILFTETGMVIATHGGPGTLAVLVVSER